LPEVQERCFVAYPLVEFFIFLFFYYYFLNHVFIDKVQELACMVRYGVKKTLIPTTTRFTSSWEKSNTPNP